MPSLTNPAAPLSPATGGRGRFQDAIKGPAPLFHKFRSDDPEPLGAASPVSIVLKGETVIVDGEDAHLLNNPLRIGKTKSSRYVALTIDKKVKRLSRLIMAAPKGMVVDHINGDPFDNRKANLRVCTLQQNNWNRKRREGGQSRFKGVSKAKKQPNRWIANIWPNRKNVFLGSFCSEEDAARAYDEAARRFYGEFACLNFPNDREQSAQRPNFHKDA